jgi:CelD/BcsL family acetyltransferase involved in cellulose biosynthesis
MPQVIEINDICALEPFRSDWHRLLAKTRGASFFQTPEWLETYWRYYGEGQKLRLLVVEDQAEMLGIVPLTVAREASRLGRLRVLTYPLHDWGSFYGPIGRDTTAVLISALRHVAETPRDWELLDLRYVPGDDADGERTPMAMEAAGMPARVGTWKEAAIIDLTPGWEAYWDGLESKMRNNLRRQLKRLEATGPVELLRHRPRGEEQGDGDPRFDLYDQCVAIARISWQGNSPTGTTLSHPGVRDYFREVHAVAARLGCVDMNLLTAGGEPVGFGYNYHYRGSVEGIRIGYDPRFAQAGAGNLLYWRMLEDGCARGDRRFDMGVGSLAIKRFWYTHTAPSYRYTYYPATALRAQLLRWKHALFGSRIREEVPLAKKQLAG